MGSHHRVANRSPSVWRRAFTATGRLGEATTAGMRLTVLRETRMTAVVCSLGPVNRIADAAGPIGDAVVAALGAWVASPGELTASSAR